MSRVRRVAAAAAITASALLPLSFSTAQPAAAYCGVRLIDDGGTGCSNKCEDFSKVADRLGLDWYCLQ